MLSSKSNRISTFIISSVGAAIVASTIFHVSFTDIIPLNTITAVIFLLVPTTFIGLLNEDIKDSYLSMGLAVVLTVLLTSFTRSFPAFLGVLPGESDIFVFVQTAETVVIVFFLMIPIALIGTMIGILLNEFIVKSQYQKPRKFDKAHKIKYEQNSNSINTLKDGT
ncbi:MAG: hypothetical protein ACFE8U_01355 [Candidatus Hermodarchaeota archaeon]